MVLGALVALLEIETDIIVVARARDGAEALALTLQHTPDVLLTDIEMPHRSGLEVAGELRRLGSATRVIIVTTFSRAGYLRRTRGRSPTRSPTASGRHCASRRTGQRARTSRVRSICPRARCATT